MISSSYGKSKFTGLISAYTVSFRTKYLSRLSTFWTVNYPGNDESLKHAYLMPLIVNARKKLQA